MIPANTIIMPESNLHLLLVGMKHDHSKADTTEPNLHVPHILLTGDRSDL